MTTDQQESASRTTVVTSPSDREIASQRVFDAPRKQVFAAYIDPELISQWWGPRGTTTVVEEMDVRPGGTWRFTIRNDSDGHENSFKGVYREVVAPERIVQTFEWEGMPGHVAIETAGFEDLGAQTRVTGISLFHTTEERDGMLNSGMESGLNDSHDRMAELLAKLS